MASSQNTVDPSVDPRKLAVRKCIFTCLNNGWAPPAEAVWRMVALREALLRGERDESIVGEEVLARLQFVKWLFEKGRMGS